MSDSKIYRIMMRFHPDGICERIFEQYQFEYGNNKLREIVNTVNASPKVNNYVNTLLRFNNKPTARELEILMNSIHYFIFSKEETLCVGALGVFAKWKSEYIYPLKFKDLMDQEEFEMPLTGICADLILKCYQNKINKTNNFFTRFFDKITEMNELEPE